MKIAGGGELKPSSFQQKKIKKIGPSGVKLRACKHRHSKTKFMASYGLSGSNGLTQPIIEPDITQSETEPT